MAFEFCLNLIPGRTFEIQRIHGRQFAGLGRKVSRLEGIDDLKFFQCPTAPTAPEVNVGQSTADFYIGWDQMMIIIKIGIGFTQALLFGKEPPPVCFDAL